MKTPMVLGYWKMRGKGHIVRMLLEYLHIEYVDKLYCSPQSFFNEEKEITHLSHNLPYLRDQKLIIFDLMPIIIYVLKKHGPKDLLGKTYKDQALIDMYHWDMQYIFRSILCSAFRNSSSREDTAKEQETVWKEHIEPTLQKIENICSDQWYLGYLTVIDFWIHQMMTYMRNLFPNEYQAFQKLNRVHMQVADIPEIKSLLQSQKTKDLHLLPKDFCKNKLC